MKVYNVNVEAKMQFKFPVVAKDLADAERIVQQLCCGGNMGKDEELGMCMDVITDLAEERFSKFGEVKCSDLRLKADVQLEKESKAESVEEKKYFRMHPAEESRMEPSEKVEARCEKMEGYKAMMEIPNTSCVFIFDKRTALEIDGEKYLLGPLYVLGKVENQICEDVTPEDILKIKIIMGNRKTFLEAEGEDIPVFKLS